MFSGRGNRRKQAELANGAESQTPVSDSLDQCIDLHAMTALVHKLIDHGQFIAKHHLSSEKSKFNITQYPIVRPDLIIHDRIPYTSASIHMRYQRICKPHDSHTNYICLVKWRPDRGQIGQISPDPAQHPNPTARALQEPGGCSSQPSQAHTRPAPSQGRPGQARPGPARPGPARPSPPHWIFI